MGKPNMTLVEPIQRARHLGNGAAIAHERAAVARAMLADCHFCAQHCGGNRLAGPAGLCHSGSEAHFFSAQVEVSDELELIPTFAVAFCGCDLRWDFCITGGPSWNSRAGLGLPARSLEAGARTMMVLGGEPGIHLPAALEFVAEQPELARLIWKTNAHSQLLVRHLLMPGHMECCWRAVAEWLAAELPGVKVNTPAPP